MISYRSPDGERHNFAFKELLSVLRKDEGAWLQRKVLSKTGFHPYVERRWSKKLFEISQQFHVPTPVMADQVYGWDNYKLRMPNFIVDAKGLYAKRSTIAGPGTSFPSPLSPAEWDAFKSIGFCRVVLAFMGNLVRTANDRNGIGIMLTNEPHVVTRLSQAFASKIKVCPTPAEIDERNADPLPTFTEWSDHALASIFDQMDGYKNIVFSVDSHTSHLSRLQPDWLHLRVGEAIDYGALRVIFQLLPTLLALRSLSIDGDTFYRDIADILTPAVSKECHRHYLSGAAVDLDTHNTYRGSTAATRILELIFYGVERGQIKPRYRDDVVVVNKKQFRAAICSNIIPVPPYSELTARLQDGRFLFKDTEKYWHFDRMVWDLNASFAGVSHP